jgi:hypothetical protein
MKIQRRGRSQKIADECGICVIETTMPNDGLAHSWAPKIGGNVFGAAP